MLNILVKPSLDILTKEIAEDRVTCAVCEDHISVKSKFQVLLFRGLVSGYITPHYGQCYYAARKAVAIVYDNYGLQEFSYAWQSGIVSGLYYKLDQMNDYIFFETSPQTFRDILRFETTFDHVLGYKPKIRIVAF